MEKIGIICEYNPLHNGHIYHIEKIKELYPDSIIILILGGYFLERGEVSLISKWNKTRLALKYGVNLVIEFPCLYNTNSADYFAEYAVRALNEAGAKKIVFGSETDDVELLKQIAKSQESDTFDIEVKRHLDSGSNYPTSLSKTLGKNLSSNDILGVSYIKAINKINKDIEPITIKRTNSYNDTSSNDEIVSASNIREKLKKKVDISAHIPDYDSSMINKIDEDKLFELLRYKILTDNHLDIYLGVDEGLENKLKKEIHNVSSFDELLEKIKSKRYTSSRLRRMLIHILLGIEKDDMKEHTSSYRVLGFDSLGQNYLKNLDSSKFVYKIEGRVSEIEKIASNIYYELTKDETVREELLNKPIKI